MTALDAAPWPHGPVHYLGLGADRMVKGFAILLAAIALFIPLALATWEAWLVGPLRSGSRASRSGRSWCGPAAGG